MPINPDVERELRRLDTLADLMDNRFSIPGTGIRFGLDSVIGLIPGVGDSVTLLPAAYLILSARRLGASRMLLARMIGNVGIDLVVGTIPLVGDLFDVGFKANRRNVDLLRRHVSGTNGDRPMRDITPSTERAA